MRVTLQILITLYIIPSYIVNTHNISSINSIDHEKSSIIGPPRELILEIACDQLRPCIKASWLPPMDYQQYFEKKDHTTDNNKKHEHGNKNPLLTYRIRYHIIHPIELSKINVDNDHNNLDHKLLTKTIEKNITGLQYTSNPGEHLFGVIYEVSVAGITENGYGRDAISRIATPESAPSDAPSNFRVIGGDQTSVQLAWEPPRLLYRNGIITKYQVRCYIVGEEENHDELKTITEQTLKLYNLPSATHACLVRAWTKAGPGPWSDRIQFLINQKGPPPPFHIQVYWKTQYILTIEWTLPEDKENIAYLIIHYAKQNNPNVWHKYFVKDLKVTEDLGNLSPNDEYLIRLSSVDLNGNEGELSNIINTNSYQHSTLIDNSNGDINNGNNNMNYKQNHNFIFMDIPDQPEKFTVQNFKCIHRTMNTITIEWLPPIHLANLLEYQLHISGRSEFITSSGVLKSVHLGDIQLHQNIDQQIDNNEPEMLNWPLVNMLNSMSSLEDHHHLQQQTHKMQIPNLKPNSQYKITIRPIYRALITEGNIGAKEGIPVTIICHTEWSAPEYIKQPELLAIYAGPSDPQGPTSIIEVKLHRVSEENGPIHNYYVIISPELNTVTTNKNLVNNDLLKSSKSLVINPSNYDLKSLSQNSDLPSNQAPYLALARHTINLFKPNHETAVIILGSEEIDNFILETQYYLHAQTNRNQTYNRNVKETTDLGSYYQDGGTSDIHETDSHINKNNEDKPYYHNFNGDMFMKTIQVNNKRLFQSTIYRVALRACSQYPNGHQLCSTSQWSDRISPINTIQSNTFSKLKSLKDKINEWNLHESSSSFTIILIGLSSGLIFFAILSTILGCILRRRKQQLIRRSMLESNNNHLDVQIYRDLSKSMFSENLSTPSNSRTKCYSPKPKTNNNNNSLMNSQPSSYLLNLHNEGSYSPSNSSNGIPILNFPHPNTGGLTVGINQISPLALSSNQLTISDLSPVITRSVYMNTRNKSESPTRSMNSSDALIGKTIYNIPSKIGTTNILENFNQLVRDGTLEIHRMPIPVEQFQEVIYQSRNNNYISFQQEFQTIEQISSTRYISAVHSNLDINKSKNRYPNILAYDCTRVSIQSNYQHHSNAQYGIVSGSDYINANYIDGYRKQKAYIATQAPLPNTFDHFWTMIWEQNTSVIVMLTKLIELGQMKCDQYWPNNGTLHFSDKLIVTHLETNELANYVIRCFELRKDKEHRKIWHLQYTSWPDQEVPTYPTVFLMFLRRVGTITPNDCGPIVVHCSSGTGRTGVYIAINILLERMKNESLIDIFGLVNQLRLQRNYMIETQEQYQFIYTALLESITDGNTEVSARNLYTHIQHLSILQTTNTTISSTNDYMSNFNNSLLSTTITPTTISTNTLNDLSNNTTTTNSLGLTGFQIEFRKINKLSPNITLTLNSSQSKTGFVNNTPPGSPIHGYKLSVSCDVAKRSVNLSKNRLVSIVPFDWNRVTLCSIRGVDGSDYINASFIDGYLKKNAYIACQGPMISTVEDFWRMVWEKHSCLIVMLCSVKESGKEKCFTYWPEDKPSRYQFFVVDLTAQYTMSSHILREFKLTDTRDGESRTIRQLQYIHWNEQGLPHTGESLIDLIGHVHKIKEQYHYDGPITIHCSSGSGRTGLFITMCNVLERLRQESVIDMYQTVKLLRQQRVWMIQTEEQYRYCYITTLDYLNSFDLCTQPQLLIQTTNTIQLNSPNLKMKSSQLNDKTVVFELDKDYELNHSHLVK